MKFTRVFLRHDFLYHVKLHEVELFCLMSCHLSQREEPRGQLSHEKRHHEDVGRPLHRKEDQILIEEEKALEGEL